MYTKWSVCMCWSAQVDFILQWVVIYTLWAVYELMYSHALWCTCNDDASINGFLMTDIYTWNLGTVEDVNLQQIEDKTFDRDKWMASSRI